MTIQKSTVFDRRIIPELSSDKNTSGVEWPVLLQTIHAPRHPHRRCLGHANGFAWASRMRQLRCVRINGELVVRTRNGLNTLGSRPNLVYAAQSLSNSTRLSASASLRSTSTQNKRSCISRATYTCATSSKIKMLKKSHVCRLIQALSPTAYIVNMSTNSCKNVSQARSPARLDATFISTAVNRAVMRSKFLTRG